MTGKIGTVLTLLIFFKSSLQTNFIESDIKFKTTDGTLMDIESNCDGQPVPPNRVDTGRRLEDLREELLREGLDVSFPIGTYGLYKAYYVPYDTEGRREFISGFTGSNGDAIVTMEQAACWTDGRYFLQAEQELDCNWWLMKMGMGTTPTYVEWLLGGANLPKGARIGADPTLMSAQNWIFFDSELSAGGMQLVSNSSNLIDKIWTDKPSYESRTLLVHGLEFAGVPFEDKISALRNDLTDMGFHSMIVSEVDEIAWLFNIRAEGGTSADGNCVEEYTCINVRDYETVIEDIITWASANLIDEKVLITQATRMESGATYAVYEAIPEDNRLFGYSPLIYPRARKNPVELQGMLNAHVRDAIVLIEFLAFLERDIKNEVDNWTELRVADTLYSMRQKMEYNRGVSFQTIAGSGSNGAVIHYRPTVETDSPINSTAVFLLDSGGQYLDGTIDVTRTFHYGSPNNEIKERYTWVLMGAIDLVTSVVPVGIQDTSLDIKTRQKLFREGLDYRHGTGHGIGAYGGVHENPTSIRMSGTPEYVYENMFFSDEPGFYKDGEYGIRLETVIYAKRKDFQSPFGNFIGFEPATLVPFEPHLIDFSLMNPRQIEWFNKYNNQIKAQIKPFFEAKQNNQVLEWLESKTTYVDPQIGKS